MTKTRAHKGKRQPPARKREASARPRIVDLRDYCSVGRPTKYVPEFSRVAETMAAAGATDVEVAQACGVTVRTLYRWKAGIPSFRHAISGAKQIAIVRVERSLYHRAVGYEHEHYKILSISGKITVVKTVKRYPPETSAARLWLQNADPLHWRPRGNPDRPKPVEPATDVEELTDNEIDARLARVEANRQARASKAHKRVRT